MPGNDAEELLPVTASEKVIKTTITQAASPVTREDMGTAYKAAIPGATVMSNPRLRLIEMPQSRVALRSTNMGADAVDQESVK